MKRAEDSNTGKISAKAAAKPFVYRDALMDIERDLERIDSPTFDSDLGIGADGSQSAKLGYLRRGIISALERAGIRERGAR